MEGTHLCWAAIRIMHQFCLTVKANPSPGTGTWITKQLKKQSPKDCKTWNSFDAVLWQVLKPTSISLFLLHAREVRGKACPHRPCAASSFTLLVHSPFTHTGPHLCTCSSSGFAAVGAFSGSQHRQTQHEKSLHPCLTAELYLSSGAASPIITRPSCTGTEFK